MDLKIESNKKKFWNKLSKPIHKDLINKSLIDVQDYWQYQYKLNNTLLIKYFIIYKRKLFYIKNDHLKGYLNLKNNFLSFFENKKSNNYVIYLYRNNNFFRIVTKIYKTFNLWVNKLKKYSIQTNFSDNYLLISQIHNNKFSKTSLFLNKINKKYYVIKIFDKKKLDNNKEYLNIFLNEWKILLKVKNRYIISLKERFEDNDNFYLSFKKFGMSLSKYVINNNKEIEEIFLQIINGLKYLQSINIIHRDLKPCNILVKKNKNNNIKVKIIDFGLSGNIDKNIYNCRTGTVGYIAPEYINFQNISTNLNFKSDIYSLGCVLYYWLKKQHLFRNHKKQDWLILNKQSIFNFDKKKFDNISKKYKDILSKCLKKNPNERLDLFNLENLI